MTENIAFNKTGSSSEVLDYNPQQLATNCKIWTENKELEPKYATDGLTAINTGDEIQLCGLVFNSWVSVAWLTIDLGQERTVRSIFLAVYDERFDGLKVFVGYENQFELCSELNKNNDGSGSQWIKCDNIRGDKIKLTRKDKLTIYEL